MTDIVTPAATRVGRGLRYLVLAGFVVALAAGALLPVYSDEIGWRFQERAWIDGVDKPAAYLVSQNSAGVVAACRHLPMEMELAAAVSGQICALSSDRLKEFAAPPPSIWGDE